MANRASTLMNRLSGHSFAAQSNHTIDRESKYLSTTRLLQRIRLGLSVLIFAAALGVVGCEGDSLRRYNKTNLSSEWFLPLWPSDFDLRPTIVLLTCGAIVAGVSLVYIIAAIIPSPHSHGRLLLLLSTAITTLCLAATITAVAFVSRVNSGSSSSSSRDETMESWTCKWARGTSREGSPPHFRRICHQEHAAFDLMAMLLAVEALRLGAVAVGWWVDIKHRRRGGGRGIYVDGEGDGELERTRKGTSSHFGKVGGLKDGGVSVSVSVSQGSV